MLSFITINCRVTCAYIFEDDLNASVNVRLLRKFELMLRLCRLKELSTLLRRLSQAQTADFVHELIRLLMILNIPLSHFGIPFIDFTS